nr:MAG TPA: hypothetical protein [Microviridae sp.]
MTSLRSSLLRFFQSPQLCLCNPVHCPYLFRRTTRIVLRKRNRLLLVQ